MQDARDFLMCHDGERHSNTLADIQFVSVSVVEPNSLRTSHARAECQLAGWRVCPTNDATLGLTACESARHSIASLNTRVLNVPPPKAEDDAPRLLRFPTGEVKCRERLAGLLKHDYQQAA